MSNHHYRHLHYCATAAFVYARVRPGPQSSV